ncbi:MAG TPA: hypothetical protein VHO70_09590 [Chitinispirillaceae bacterium]|nr:hypothetical protein [Chitinispirillaceae bacterium]
MYKIEKTDYGAKLTFDGFIRQEEMAKWVTESIQFIHSMPSKFGVLVDMRGLKPLSHDAEMEMQKGQKLYKDKGMERSAVILANSVTTMQFKRIAQETGIYQWERYIDSSKVTSWEEVSKNWITKAVDPDK